MHDRSSLPAHVFGVARVHGVGFQVFEEKDGKRRSHVLFQKSDDANEEASRLFSLAEAFRQAGRLRDRTVELGPLMLQLWDAVGDE